MIITPADVAPLKTVDNAATVSRRVYGRINIFPKEGEWKPAEGAAQMKLF